MLQSPFQERTIESTCRTLGSLIDSSTPPVEPQTGRRRAPLVYRGSGTASRPLLSSLDQLGGVEPPHSKRDLEGFLLRAYARESRRFMTNGSAWELLVSARHHGLPTRLLDWSSSVLVAAHFATLRPSEEPAAIWMLDWHRVHERFGLTDLSLTIDDLRERFGDALPFDAAGLGRAFGAEPFMCLVDPPQIDPRISAQFASFTLCSDTTCSLDQFLARHDLSDTLTRVLIDRADVSLIRDQLDFLGFDERLLFPDLDGAASAIRRYYS